MRNRTRRLGLSGLLTIGALCASLFVPAAMFAAGPATATATTTTTTTTACSETHWPRSVQGMPTTLKAGARAGDYIWHNSTGWHLRVTHPGTTKVIFSGRIVSTKPITFTPYRLEPGDTLDAERRQADPDLPVRQLRSPRRLRLQDRVRPQAGLQRRDGRGEAPGRADLDRLLRQAPAPEPVRGVADELGAMRASASKGGGPSRIAALPRFIDTEPQRGAMQNSEEGVSFRAIHGNESVGKNNVARRNSDSSHD